MKKTRNVMKKLGGSIIATLMLLCLTFCASAAEAETDAAMISSDNVTENQFKIDKNAFTDHTAEYGGAYLDESNEKYCVDFRVTVYIREPFSTFTVEDYVDDALAFLSPDFPDNKPVTLEGVDTSADFWTNDPASADLMYIDAMVTNTVDGGKNTIVLTAPEDEQLPAGAYQLRVPADITGAVRLVQTNDYPQYYSTTAHLVKVDDYVTDEKKEWKSLVPTHTVPRKAGGYVVDPVTDEEVLYNGKPVICWEVYFGWDFYDKTTFVDTLTGMKLLVNEDYLFEIHSFDNMVMPKERLASFTSLTDKSYIDFNENGDGFTFNSENLDLNSDGSYVKLYKLVYFAVPADDADSSTGYVTTGLKNSYTLTHTDPFGNGFDHGPITGEVVPSVSSITAQGRLEVKKEHVIERNDSLTQWLITCDNTKNEVPFAEFDELKIIDLVPQNQTTIGEVTVHYSDDWPIEVEMVCSNNQRVALTEGTHYSIVKSLNGYAFGDNGKYGFAVDLDMDEVGAVLDSQNCDYFKTIEVKCYLNNKAHPSGNNCRIENEGWLDYANQGMKLVDGVNAYYDRGFATKRKEEPRYGDYYDPTTFRNYTVCTVNGKQPQAFTGGYDNNPANGDDNTEILWKIFVSAREFGNDKDPITVTVTDTISDNQMFPAYNGKSLKDLFLIEAVNASDHIIVPDSVSLNGNTFTLTFTVPGGAWAKNSESDSRDICIYYHTVLKPKAIGEALDAASRAGESTFQMNYSNTASVGWNGESYTMPTSSGSTSFGVTMLDKSGAFIQSAGNKVEYTIKMNPLRADLQINSDVVRLEDQMGAGKDMFVYLETSFRLMNMDNAKLLQRSGVVSESTYVLTMAEDGKSFTLDVPDETRLRLTYQVRTIQPVGTKDVKLINTASLAGHSGSPVGIEFDVSASHQSAPFEVASDEAAVRILKISSEDTSENSPTGRAGAEFSVTELNADGTTKGPASTMTTDSAGIIELRRDGLHTEAAYFLIEETKAPTGYMIGEKPWKGCYAFVPAGATVDDTVMNALKASTGCAYVLVIPAGCYKDEWVENEPVSLTIHKVDENGNTLLGAAFDLKDSSGNTISPGPVTFVGKLKYIELKAGKYTLEEKTAPKGYKLPENPVWELTIGSDGKATVETGTEESLLSVSDDGYTVTVVNEPAGSLKITKTFEGVPEGADLSKLSFTINDGSKETVVTYADFTDGEYLIENIPVGAVYTVTETNAEGLIANYTLDAASVTEGTASIKKGTTETIALSNTYKQDVGSLEITKTATGCTVPAGTAFTVTGPNNYSKTVTYAEFENGEYTLSDLPVGEYTVSEDTATAAVANYTLTVSGNGETATVTKDGIASLTIANTYTQDVGSLKITKTFSGQPATADLGKLSFTITGVDDYSKTVTFAEFENGEYTLSGLAVGEYTVTETNAGTLIANYTLDASSVTEGTVTIEKDKTVTIALTNTYKQDVGSLKITKTFSGQPENAKLDDLRFKISDGTTETTVTYADFTDGEYLIENVPAGTVYTVTETNADTLIANYTLATTSITEGTATITKDTTVTITLTNKYTQDLGSLKITKTFSGQPTNADLGKLSFTINDGSKETVVTYADFTDGEYIIENVPVGTVYTVTETNADTLITNYTLESTSVTKGEAAITKKDEVATIALTNTYKQDVGSLKITKTFSGQPINADLSKLSFTINDGSKETVVTYADFTNGEYLIENVPVGAVYTVTETNADTLITNYTLESTSVTKGEAVITKKDEVATIELTNKYTQDLGSLKITKTFSGQPTNADLSKLSFTIDDGTTETTVTYADFTDGEYLIENVPAGTKYTVMETNADTLITNYTLADISVTAGTATIAKDTTVTIALTNKYTQNVGSLKITKTFSGQPATADLSKLSFTIDDGTTETTVTYADFTDGEYLIENVPAGTKYTVMETNADTLITNYTLADISVTAGTATIAKDTTVTIALTNKYTQNVGSLKITKTFSGQPINADLSKLSFTINDGSKETVVTYADFTNGEYLIENVPVGTVYTVTETNAEGLIANYTLDAASVTEGTASIKKGTTATIALTNTYTQDLGNLKITKTFSGQPATADLSKLSFTINDGSKETVVTYADFTDGEYLIENVPAGTKYTVMETNADTLITNYTLADISVTAGNATIAKDTTVTIALTNKYTQDLGSLKITKTFSGQPINADLSKLSFTINDGSKETVVTYADFTNGEYLIENVPVGTVYTVTETNADTLITNYTLESTSVTKGEAAITKKDEVATIALTNTYKQDVGSLKITKTFSGQPTNADLGKLSFTISDGTTETTVTYADFTNGEHIITNVPVGTVYTVTETNADTLITNYTLESTSVTKGEAAITKKDEVATIALTNTYKQDVGSLKITKTFSGQPINADLSKLSFTINDGSKETVVTYADFTDGEYLIENIPVGTKYTVMETKAEGLIANYTLDSASVTEGTASIKKDTTVTIALSNTYTYKASGALNLTATKAVNGADPREDQVFTFELLDAAGNVLQIKQNDKGSISFDAITYTEADIDKSFLYKVQEKQEIRAGYTFDKTVYTVAVWVADNGDGTLKATKTISREGKAVEAITFNNAYEASGELKLSAVKTVNGAEPREDQVYEFALIDQDGNTILAENEKGEIIFDTLTYNQSDAGKTYTYTVKETAASTDLLEVDESVYTIDVTVIDNKNGTLAVQPVITRDGEPAQAISFANTLYAPLTISKTVEGCETAETFSFTVKLYDADGTEATGEYAYTGDVEGKLKSGDDIMLAHGQSVTISGLLPGMTYTVTEAATTAFETTVNGNAGNSIEGTLAENANEVSFVNTFKTTMFMVKKSWRGGGGGAIKLTLYANGKKLDPQPAYTRDENVYVYSDLPMYDEQEQIIVYSAKEKYVDGFLTIYANVAPYQDETKAIYHGGTIINKAIVKADFSVKKEWTGLTEGEEAPEITLVLYCNGVATDIKTPKPDQHGWYKYYNLPDEVDGVKADYTVKEQAVSGYMTRYMLADGTSAEYADNGGTIINAKIPQTGDQTSLALWLTLMGASTTMLMLLRKRRKA